MFLKKQENLGVFFVLVSALITSIGPIMVNKGVKNIPPLMFASISFIMSALFFLFICISQKRLSEFKQKKSNIYFDLFLITIFVVIIPYTLFFIGSAKTTGLNSSLLQLSELLFALLVAYFVGEKNTLNKYIGAGGILIGSIFLIYHGSLQLNFGDILIVLSAASFPLGNFYAKKALNILSPSVILFFRYLVGGLFIFLLSLIFESYTNFKEIFFDNWKYFFSYGFLVMPLSTFLWYQSLRRLDISKATSLNMLYPFFSVLILMILGEKINIIQFIGIVIIFLGVYFTFNYSSTDPKLTKYAHS